MNKKERERMEKLEEFARGYAECPLCRGVTRCEVQCKFEELYGAGMNDRVNLLKRAREALR